MTTTVTTEEGMASVFVAVDHCSVDCVGIHAAKSGNRFEALEPIRQGVAERFAGLEADVAEEGLKPGEPTTTAPPICPMTFSGRSPTWA